jgi:hypothetical protein
LRFKLLFLPLNAQRRHINPIMMDVPRGGKEKEKQGKKRNFETKNQIK